MRWWPSLAGIGLPGFGLAGAALLLALCAPTGHAASGMPELTPQQALHIGRQIWHNEGLGKVENLTVWNAGEDFPSFGIGHFIWYPAGVKPGFTESFPQLLQHLRTTTLLPAWLQQQRHAPWPDRAAFYADIDSLRMHELRQLLQVTLPQQVEFIVQRMDAALPKILVQLPDAAQRNRIQARFYRVAAQPNGLYALIDYINFKGEGIAAGERYQEQGWGLLQVLQEMNDAQAVMADFVRAADTVLTRRVQNAPRDESRWLPGWRNRLQTYLQRGTVTSDE